MVVMVVGSLWGAHRIAISKAATGVAWLRAQVRYKAARSGCGKMERVGKRLCVCRCRRQRCGLRIYAAGVVGLSAPFCIYFDKMARVVMNIMHLHCRLLAMRKAAWGFRVLGF